MDNLKKVASVLAIAPKILCEGGLPAQQAIIDEKDAAINELLAILQAKDVRYILMSKKLLLEILKTFLKQ